MALSIYGSSYTPFFSNRAYTRVARMRAAITARRSAADAPAGPGVAVGHSQANPSPPGAASGPYGKPNSGNLAPARSRVARVHDWRPRGCLPTSPTAAEGIRRASRTPSTLPPPVLPLPAACASVRPACLAALCGQPDRHHWHTAAMLRRRWGLRQRSKRGGVSCRRQGRESRVAREQQRSQVKPSQVKSVSKLSRCGDGSIPMRRAHDARKAASKQLPRPATRRTRPMHAAKTAAVGERRAERGARVRRPLRAAAVRPPPFTAGGAERGGGAATALGPATARQRTRVNGGRPGRVAQAAQWQQRRHLAAPMATHVASRAHMHASSRAPLTLRARPRRATEKAAVAPMTMATTSAPSRAAFVYRPEGTNTRCERQQKNEPCGREMFWKTPHICFDAHDLD